MQMETGKEAWNPARALSDLNEACVYKKKAYSMHSLGQAMWTGKAKE